MYKAKSDGRNRYEFYSDEMTKAALERLTLQTDFISALKNNEFIVYLQPQVDAISLKISGMEALTRWNHPRLGLISPEKFIHIAESTGLIVNLDRYVMEKTMQTFSKWYKQGLEPGILALNLSVRQLQQKDFLS